MKSRWFIALPVARQGGFCAPDSGKDTPNSKGVSRETESDGRYPVELNTQKTVVLLLLQGVFCLYYEKTVKIIYNTIL